MVKSILPSRNNFVFFEVNPLSFHQVSNEAVHLHGVMIAGHSLKLEEESFIYLYLTK